jgi:hypothetical protein
MAMRVNEQATSHRNPANFRPSSSTGFTRA